MMKLQHIVSYRQLRGACELPIIHHLGTYLANWRHINARRKQSVLYDNDRENRTRIADDYNVGDYVYVISKDIKRKLAPAKQGPFMIIRVHTNATVTIQRSAFVSERINIRRIYPAHMS